MKSPTMCPGSKETGASPHIAAMEPPKPGRGPDPLVDAPSTTVWSTVRPKGWRAVAGKEQEQFVDQSSHNKVLSLSLPLCNSARVQRRGGCADQATGVPPFHPEQETTNFGTSPLLPLVWGQVSPSGQFWRAFRVGSTKKKAPKQAMFQRDQNGSGRKGLWRSSEGGKGENRRDMGEKKSPVAKKTDIKRKRFLPLAMPPQ